MLVTKDLRRWLFRAKDNWALAARENGNQTSDFGCLVFSDIFKSLIQVIAGMEVPASRPGKYVCDICPYDGIIRVVWFEPVVDACCPKGYDVCCLTAKEVNGAENLEQLWQLFVDKLVQGLSALVEAMAKEIAVCHDRLKSWKLAQEELSHLLTCSDLPETEKTIE